MYRLVDLEDVYINNMSDTTDITYLQSWLNVLYTITFYLIE